MNALDLVPFELVLLVFGIGVAVGALLVSMTVLLRAHWLRQRVADAELALHENRARQAAVIHQSKLAALGQMIAGVAHEINTPLGYVKSNLDVAGEIGEEFADAVAKEMVDLEQQARADGAPITAERIKLAAQALAAGDWIQARELLGDAKDGVRRIERVISNLKGFARLDRDGPERVDINACVRETLLVAGQSLKPNVQVAMRLADLPGVVCMPSELNQVLLNLVTNAAQAMSGKGRIDITTRVAADRMVEIEVADSGPGMTPEVRARIFEPFFSTKPPGVGTGLGLAICEQIVKAHGGTIDVVSSLGAGARFTIRLPTDPPLFVSNPPPR